MKIEVNKYSLSPRWFVGGTKGSYGAEQLEFIFSSDWEGLAKKVTFIPYGGEEVSVVYNGPFAIPYEVMVRAGTCVFAVSGYKGTSKLLTVTGEIKILETVASPDNSAVVPTPDEMTQVMEMANTALENSLTAVGMAESTKEDVDYLCGECDRVLERAEKINNSTQGYLEEIASIKEYVGNVAFDMEGVSYEAEMAKNTAIEACDTVENAKQAVLNALENVIVAEGNLKENFSNPVVGKLAGNAARTDDVSPFIHKYNISVKGESKQEGTPSKESPAEVKDIEDPVIKLLGKNLIKYPFDQPLATVNGMIFTDNNDGTLTLNGTLSADETNLGAYRIYNDESTPMTVLRKGVTYIARLYDSQGNVISGTSFDFRICTGKDWTTVGSVGSGYTPQKDTPVNRVLIYITSCIVGSEYKDYKIFPVLEVASDDTSSSFEPWSEQKITIPLTLAGKGDYRDEIIVDRQEKKVTHIKRYHRYDFTGNETWYLPSVSTSHNTTIGVCNLYSEPIAVYDVSLDVCNISVAKSMYNTDVEGFYVSSPDVITQVFARIANSETDVPRTGDEFRAHFCEGTYIYYPMKEPVYTDCTDTEWGQALLALSSDGETLTFDCDGATEITYNKDINKVIARLTEAIVALGGTV